MGSTVNMDREKEREAELECAMYTNCLLLGLDPAVIGGGPRAGQFRHSNPRLGEHLLHFLLSALRGPHQASKDFDKVWPIFDSAQSRDFRKIVQGIISELESQGALPRSNSRVSSLATCCGPRFVELLWQLSVHALREVHKRTFSEDVASNPLPASLTDVSYLHAAALLPVTKARIALERRKFLKNANTAVHRQNTWSNLAHEMTAEFRALCAEEAYLQQEMEKLQDMRNKARLEGELWDERPSSSNQNSHLVSKATRLWESLLARKSQHEVLASGPIEDLIAHREHRYRISGSSLLAAMDLSSHVPQSDVVSIGSGEISRPIDSQSQADSPQLQGNTENLSRLDDRGARSHPTVDVAEILRRWTHALQRIHKQSLQLAKANDGEGPELLRYASDTGSSCHADSLAATLVEHRQHLVSIQGLINQLKEAVPAMQKSISELTEEVSSISSITADEYTAISTSPVQVHNNGRELENNFDDIVDVTSKFSSVQLDKVASGPTIKLPQLFSLTPNSGKSLHMPKQHIAIAQANHAESFPSRKPVDSSSSSDHTDSIPQDDDALSVQKLKRSVRQAALARHTSNLEHLYNSSIDEGSGHFFMPVSTCLVSHKEVSTVPNHTKQKLSFSGRENSPPGTSGANHYFDDSKLSSTLEAFDFVNTFDDYRNHATELQAVSHLLYSSPIQGSFPDDQALSPPLLMDSFPDAYEDLLAPLSETDAALMER